MIVINIDTFKGLLGGSRGVLVDFWPQQRGFAPKNEWANTLAVGLKSPKPPTFL